MNCDYFRVLYNDIVLVDYMTLENALLFVKALFEKFWQEPGGYKIEKMDGGQNDVE